VTRMWLWATREWWQILWLQFMQSLCGDTISAPRPAWPYRRFHSWCRKSAFADTRSATSRFQADGCGFDRHAGGPGSRNLLQSPERS